MIKTDKFGKMKVLQFYLFCIFQHFDCENKLLLWNCLEFKFCGFLDNCIRKYFSFLSDSLNHKCYFFIFFFFAFQVCLLLFFHILNKVHFLKDDYFYFWLVHNSFPFCKFWENNWSKSNNNSDVSKITKNCLTFMNTFILFLLFVFCWDQSIFLWKFYVFLVKAPHVSWLIQATFSYKAKPMQWPFSTSTNLKF